MAGCWECSGRPRTLSSLFQMACVSNMPRTQAVECLTQSFMNTSSPSSAHWCADTDPPTEAWHQRRETSQCDSRESHELRCSAGTACKLTAITGADLLPDNNLRTIEAVFTLSACLDSCNGNPMCKAAVFNSALQKCFHKSAPYTEFVFNAGDNVVVYCGSGGTTSGGAAAVGTTPTSSSATARFLICTIARSCHLVGRCRPNGHTIS